MHDGAKHFGVLFAVAQMSGKKPLRVQRALSNEDANVLRACRPFLGLWLGGDLARAERKLKSRGTMDLMHMDVLVMFLQSVRGVADQIQG